MVEKTLCDICEEETNGDQIVFKIPFTTDIIQDVCPKHMKIMRRLFKDLRKGTAK